jgi:tetratricopeptide (TPR) repeat protein
MSDTPGVPDLVHQAIAAAKAGRRGEARALLARVLRRNPQHVTAWLWMSGVVDSPQEQVECLRRVLAIDPENPVAQKGLASTRTQGTQTLLAQGIAAAEAGDAARARDLLTQVVEQDEENVTAWLWLSRVVETTEERLICFENVLTLDPDNAEAQAGLAQEPTPYNLWASEEDEDATTSDARVPPTVAAAVLGEAYVQQHIGPILEEPEPEAPPATVALWAPYDDETRCPYCGAPTELEDRRCPSCRQRLWRKVRRRNQRSTLLWILTLIQAGNTVMTAVGPLTVIFYVSWRLRATEYYGELLGMYFGVPQEMPAEIAARALVMFPRIAFLLSWLPTLVSAALTVAIFLRWPPVFYLLLVNAGIGVLTAVAGLVISAAVGGGAMVGSLISLALSLAVLVITFQLEDDFLRDRARILLRVDSDVKDGLAALKRGRRYAALGMWALAAIHLRRATGWATNNAGAYMSLAEACLHIGEPELAEAQLAEAQRIRPDHPALADLMAQVREELGELAPEDEPSG